MQVEAIEQFLCNNNDPMFYSQLTNVILDKLIIVQPVKTCPFLWNPKDNFIEHKSPSSDCALSNIHGGSILFKIHFNIIVFNGVKSSTIPPDILAQLTAYYLMVSFLP
jgi:hypothetical protein